MKTTATTIAALLALTAAAAETHTVTFRRLNGTVLQTAEVAHGADATALVPAAPAESGFIFSAWDGAEKLACVAGDVTCWALYEAETAKSPSTSISPQPVAVRETPYSLDEYFQLYDNLAWSDEFSGTSLSVGSGNNWNYDTEQRNKELQRYTQGGNHIVSDGTLKLECRRESGGGKSFTSGSIKSNDKVQFKYGRCEIRAKLTKQQGTWPAFWTMGTGSWPACGELDVFEQVNGSEWIGGNFHLPKGSSTISNSGLVCPEDGTHWGDAFHRIGFIFNEFEAVWYVDDHIFKRMDIRNTSRYSMMHDRYRYILLNLAFGGNWPGQTAPDDTSIADFQSEAFEIDYCRIFTNTTANRTIEREVEPEGTRLTTPVKATVWRGWQMKWGKVGAYRSATLDRTEAAFCKAALTEYFTRDNADIVTFLTRPAENTGAADLTMPFNVPGVTSLFLSPEQGSNNNSWDGDTRETLLSGVLFNKERFSQSRSAIGSLPLSNDADYTNCCAVVAELVEKDSGAKVKVVSVNVSQTNGLDYATLFSKLNRFKNERTILLFQSMDWSYHAPLRKQATASLDSAYRYLGEYNAWPTYQFAYATTNCVSASAEIPAPLSVLKSNGQPSGVHTNQAFCATVTFEAPQPDPEPAPSPVVADGDWFHAIPDGHGGSIETNGVWTTPPVATNAASYTVGATSEFTLTGEAQSAGSNRLVRAEADLVFDGTCTLDSLSDVQTGDSLAAIVAIEGDGGGEATWAACVGGMWIQMEGGATPTNGGIYRLRMEGDFTIASPRVRLSISADGGSTFGTLRHGGEEWLAPNNQARRHFSAVATDGPGELAAIRGALPDAPGAARRTIFIIQ